MRKAKADRKDEKRENERVNETPKMVSAESPA